MLHFAAAFFGVAMSEEIGVELLLSGEPALASCAIDGKGQKEAHQSSADMTP
jgi:hypothetical protein